MSDQRAGSVAVWAGQLLGVEQHLIKLWWTGDETRAWLHRAYAAKNTLPTLTDAEQEYGSGPLGGRADMAELALIVVATLRAH